MGSAVDEVPSSPNHDVTPGGLSGPDDVMRYESRRLSTFARWPSNAKVEARKIAKAGFFHVTGTETEVKCSWCACVLNQWDYGDQVRPRLECSGCYA
jgi:hypothetical protein